MKKSDNGGGASRRALWRMGGARECRHWQARVRVAAEAWMRVAFGCGVQSAGSRFPGKNFAGSKKSTGMAEEEAVELGEECGVQRRSMTGRGARWVEESFK
jgi:hypothetical protein